MEVFNQKSQPPLIFRRCCYFFKIFLKQFVAYSTMNYCNCKYIHLLFIAQITPNNKINACEISNVVHLQNTCTKLTVLLHLQKVDKAKEFDAGHSSDGGDGNGEKKNNRVQMKWICWRQRRRLQQSEYKCEANLLRWKMYGRKMVLQLRVPICNESFSHNLFVSAIERKLSSNKTATETRLNQRMWNVHGGSKAERRNKRK